VLPRTDGLFRQVALDVAAFFPDIETDELLIDTAAYWMVKDPLRFDVIVTLNVYGDILSDMAAAWGGGLGYAPTLNAGDGVAMAEPVHGSAPDIAGRGIANPTAVILSAAMLARHHWGLADAASRIENAVFRALADGATTADVSRENALSTEAYTDAVLARL
jgi:homoisocitrate dehydrogenase